MPNINFSYLYRDGANYKNYHSIIFDNPDNIDLKDFEVFIKSKLIDDTWFYANEWQLPDLRSDICNYEIDPTWHEFENVVYTDGAYTVLLNLNEFLNFRD